MKPGELRRFQQDLGRYREGDIALFVGSVDHPSNGGQVATFIHENQRREMPLYSLTSYTVRVSDETR